MSIQLCGQGGNTGGIKCAVAPDKIQTIAIWGGNLTPAEYETLADIKSTLVADSKLSKSDSNKLFLLPLRVNMESKKEANTEQTFSNGVKVVAREGLPGYRLSYFTSTAQVKKLRQLNNKILPVIVQDAKKNVWGTADADLNFIGRKAILFFDGLDHPADDQTSSVGYFDIMFLDSIENYDEAYFIVTDFNFQTALSALLDVQLFEKAASVDNVLKVSGKVDTAQINAPYDIYEDHKLTLFSTGALWAIKNLQTNAAITVTSIAPNAAGYGDLTVDNAAYTALNSGDKIEVSTVLPPALDAAGVKGIETISFIHEKP